MKAKPCKVCGSAFHQAFQCPENPKAIQKRKETQQRMIEKQKAKQAIKKPAVKKKKLTMRDVNAKIKNGGNLTKAELKIQFKNQKDKAWKAFSDFIRHRDSLATTGTFEFSMCVTCMVRGDYTQFPYARIQAGHAVGGRGNAVLFHEEIVNGQCDHDNRQGAGGLAGDYGNYMIFLVKKYGLEHAESLQRLKYQTKDYSYQDLIDIEAEYKEKLQDLKENKDIRLKLV